MGGAWERMIDLPRKVLDSMLMREGLSNLSDEVLCTLMAEVSAVINNRPLVPVCMDADSHADSMAYSTSHKCFPRSRWKGP